MALKNYEVVGWRLQSLLHFYLWPMPVNWDNEYTKLVITKPMPNCIPFILLTFYEPVLALSSFYVTIKYFISDLNLYKMNAVVMISIGYSFAALFVLIIQGYGCIQGIVGWINTLLDLGDKCENGMIKI